MKACLLSFAAAVFFCATSLTLAQGPDAPPDPAAGVPIPTGPGGMIRATLGATSADVPVVEPDAVPIPTRQQEESGEPEIRVRIEGEPFGERPTSILRDQAFNVELTLPEKALPKDANGRVDANQIPPEQTITFVLPEQRGTVDLALRYKGGRSWGTATPLSILRGGGSSLHMLGLEFSTILGSTRVTGGVGSLDVRDGEYLMIRYQAARTELRAHESALKQAIAAYRDGFLQVISEMNDRLAHQGFTAVELAALQDPDLPPQVKADVLASAATAEDLKIMQRKRAYAGHALLLLDSDRYALDTTKFEIARAYAGITRYPQSALFDEDGRPGGASGFGFDYLTETEMKAFSRAIESAKERKSEAILRGAAGVAMGFYEWTVAESGAGDFVMLAGINPMTGKKATTRERAEAAFAIMHSAAMNKVQGDALAELQDGVGTSGSRRERDPSEPAPDADAPAANRPVAQPPENLTPVPDRPAPLPNRPVAQPPENLTPVPDYPAPVPNRPAAHPPENLPPVPDRPAPLPNRPIAQPPENLPPVPDRPAPLPNRPIAQPPENLPPVPDRPAPLPSRPIAQPPENLPPVPDRPAPLPNRPIAQPPESTPPMRPTIEYPVKPTIEYPSPPKPGSVDTKTMPVRPSPDRVDRSELPTSPNRPPARDSRERVYGLRRELPPEARRKVDESEALLEGLIEQNPRLRDLDRDQLSTYLALHSGRERATPLQLAAEAANYHGGRVTPKEIERAAGVPPSQAERAVRQGWDDIKMEGVDIHNPPPLRRIDPDTALPGPRPPQPPSPPPANPPPVSRPPTPDAPTLPLGPKPPNTADSARSILGKLEVKGLDRAAAEAYIANHGNRPGVTDAQLVAEAVRGQGRPLTPSKLAEAAGLPDARAGKAVLDRAVDFLGAPPKEKAAVQLAAAGQRSPEVAEQVARWQARNARRDAARAEALQQQRRELAERIAQAPALPPRPPDARHPGFVPTRYLVEGDTDYLQQIMRQCGLRSSQVAVSASRVNKLVDSMLRGRRETPKLEAPVRVSPDGRIDDGHHRVIAGVIVAARTGRPLFQSWGENGILPGPGSSLQAGARDQRALDWRLRVDP